MAITDLDGTLLNPDQKVSSKDVESLVKLGEKGIVRVIATGRLPLSFSRVIPDDFPIDYLVFSSGTGVMDWNAKEILKTHTLPKDKVWELAVMLRQEDVSFHLMEPAPENHRYFYYSNGEHHPDFDKRMEYYRGYETEICFDLPNFSEASQLLIIMNRDVRQFNRLKSKCQDVKVVRATSPIDLHSIWMEIFHPDVSKGNACRYLCEKLNIPVAQTMAVGNDYNDLDLLAFAQKSYVVSNTPEDLKMKFQVVNSNQENGFTSALIASGIIL